MKVVILAGGLGTRISEESHLKPKPMIEIGGKPILWHIMKIYSYYGYNEFIICLGYKGHMIKDFFANYYLYTSDVTFDFTEQNAMTIHNNISEPWKVTLVDTGLHTMTGGRVKRIKDYIGNETFMLTYGDGVSNVDLRALEEFHNHRGKMMTLTAVMPGGRFGVLDIDASDHGVKAFREKSQEDGGWINGGFMILEPNVFEFIKDDQTSFESETLEALTSLSEVNAYKHHGFWQCMDTQRDKASFEKMIIDGITPWMVW